MIAIFILALVLIFLFSMLYLETLKPQVCQWCGGTKINIMTIGTPTHTQEVTSPCRSCTQQ